MIKIFDLTNRLIKIMLYKDEKIDIANFSSGIYLLEITTSKGIAYQKILKR